MIEIVIPSDQLSVLTGALLIDTVERCAVLVCRSVQSGPKTRFLVRELVVPSVEEYSSRSETHASLSPSFVARVAQRVRREGLSLVFAHSHPFDPAVPEFSPIDDSGEAELSEFLQRRAPGAPHAALVVSPGGMRVRELGTASYGRLVEVGSCLVVHADRRTSASDERHDRQVRAFGVDAQTRLAELHVAVVGAGGTGSLVVQQLAHLGIGKLTIVDPDIIQPSNLNRVVGATQDDVDKPKSAVAAKHARAIDPRIAIDAVVESILVVKHAQRLTSADLIFGCTDSHGSRVVLNQIAYQYMIPCIDMGVVIVARDGVVERAAGRVQLLSPGLGCLTCGANLDAEQVRRDFMTDFERQADPYIIGGDAPQPAVISLNGAVASLAVTMLLAVVAGVPSRSRCSLYNALSGTVRAGNSAREAGCVVCSSSGSLGRADEWPLPGRRL